MPLRLIFGRGIHGWTKVLVVRIRDSIHHLEDSRIYCVYPWPGRCLEPGHAGMDSFWPRVHPPGLIWWRAGGLDMDPEAGVGTGRDCAVDCDPYKPKAPAARVSRSLWVEVLSANRIAGGCRCPVSSGRWRTRSLTLPHQSLAGGEGQSQNLRWVVGLDFVAASLIQVLGQGPEPSEPVVDVRISGCAALGLLLSICLCRAPPSGNFSHDQLNRDG